MKSKLKDFSQHRFIVQHTSDVYDQVASSLTDSMLLKIHDFSENYTCLLPEEIQFALDTGETAKLYPIVVLWKVNDEICEDHITFLSDEKKHDVPLLSSFVQLCNSCQLPTL